jgi:hypothetical protein
VDALQVTSDIATALVAIANLVLVFFALRNLQALKDQIRVGQDAATAAKESADAAAETVREATRTRVDDQAPRVVVLMETPTWPPYVDRQRHAMPGGGERTLYETIGQSEVAGSQPYFFDAHKSWLMWFCTRGVLINEGNGTARVRLDGSARFIAGESEIFGADRPIPVPPKIGSEPFPEYVLRPGDAALFEWGDGHTLGDWADAYVDAHPPNPRGACFLVVTVMDWLSSGVIDHNYVLLQARPIEPVPGMQGQWQLRSSPHGEVGVGIYPPQRTYRAHHEEGTYFAPAPWQDMFAEWNAKHSPPTAN